MQFSLLAAFLLATTPALGFKPIPEGTPDGVYSVSRDAAGNEVHTREGDVAFRAAALPRAIRGGSLLKRDGIDEFGCFKAQQELGHGDCDNAVRALRAQIPDSGRTVGSHLGLYSISGDVVAYACNNRMAANTFYNSDQTYANQGITRLCGPYEPGFGYNTGSHLTYGQQHKSYSWCPEH